MDVQNCDSCSFMHLGPREQLPQLIKNFPNLYDTRMFIITFKSGCS
jgi:hypothetical protein